MFKIERCIFVIMLNLFCGIKYSVRLPFTIEKRCTGEWEGGEHLGDNQINTVHLESGLRVNWTTYVKRLGYSLLGIHCGENRSRPDEHYSR